MQCEIAKRSKFWRNFGQLDSVHFVQNLQVENLLCFHGYDIMQKLFIGNKSFNGDRLSAQHPSPNQVSMGGISPSATLQHVHIGNFFFEINTTLHRLTEFRNTTPLFENTCKYTKWIEE